MENEMEFIPQAEMEAASPHIPGVAVDTHFDFKLEGWPASAALITLCLSCVMVYGIAVWGKTRPMHTTSAPS